MDISTALLFMPMVDDLPPNTSTVATGSRKELCLNDLPARSNVERIQVVSLGLHSLPPTTLRSHDRTSRVAGLAPQGIASTSASKVDAIQIHWIAIRCSQKIPKLMIPIQT